MSERRDRVLDRLPALGSAAERRQMLVRGVGTILLGAILLGAMAVFVGLAAREMSSVQVAFVRFGGALLVLLAWRRGRTLRARPGNFGPLLLRGLLGVGAIILYYRGIEGAGAGLATLLTNTYPLFTALFAATLMGEPFSGRLGAALVLSLAGMVTVLGPGVALSLETVRGGVSALGAAVLAGGAVAAARHLRMTESAFLITTYFMALGAVCTAPALLLGLPVLSPRLFVTLAAVVLTSVGGQLLLHQGLGFALATQGSLAAATSVVTAAALEAAWLGEQWSARSMLGGGLLMAAVVLAATRH